MIYTVVCQVVSLLVLAYFVIMFVGYWTGATYYFNIVGIGNKKESLVCAAIVNGMAWLFFGVVQLLGAVTNARPPEYTHNFSWGIIGTVDMILIFIVFMCYGYSWFEKSREYFWNKRTL